MDCSNGTLESEVITAMTQQLEEVVIDKISDPDPTVVGNPVEGTSTLKPRNYQLEMVEESLKRNIIVALDTGSGKTQIAVLRIRAELERNHKLIWFLAPTLTLCHQQYLVLKSQIPNVQVKFLSGNDGVDRWSEQSLWDSVLQNVRIVVSSYDILRDALTHGFVTMEQLALIVIDEAHNCVKAHSGAQIMNIFYHTRKSEGLPVPLIMGLTASPTINSSPGALEKIEQTLDAICRTPTKHRAEVLQYVKPPKVLRVEYTPMLPNNQLYTSTPTLSSLHKVYVNLDIMQDPEIVRLRTLPTDRGRRDLQKAIEKRKTYCQEQLKSFCLTSSEICHELGTWAADFFISQAISLFLAYVEEDNAFEESWKVASRRYTATVLKRVKVVEIASSPMVGTPMVSPKVETFIDLLLQENNPNFAGITFVQQRATVAVLAHLLSVHPRSKGIFTLGTFVGTSQHKSRDSNINDLLDIREQRDTLTDFKQGSRNLIIATSVLEEGIDVSACAFVACFSRPANLKAYIQRRGRARKLDSKIAVMISTDEVDKLKKWQELEDTMRKLYEDELRQLNEIAAQEDEDKEEDEKREFWVESTGAHLDLNNAVSHLYHFCATLPAGQHIDIRPDIYCEDVGNGKVRARAVLPLSVDKTLRLAKSKLAWKSERNAIKDVAFEAYMTLYNARLINENLMPLLRHKARNSLATGIEKRPSLVEVAEQINPWTEVAKLWSQQLIYVCSVSICNNDSQEISTMQVFLPVPLSQIPATKIYWNANTILTVSSTTCARLKISLDMLAETTSANKAMLDAAFGHRFPISDEDFTVLFGSQDLLEITRHHIPHQSAVDRTITEREIHELGLIRDLEARNIPYIFKGWLESRPENASTKYPANRLFEGVDHVPHILVSALPHRSDFLHEVAETKATIERVLPVTSCTIENLPLKYVQFAMLIPSIVHLIEIQLIAAKLNETMFAGIEFHDLSLLISAISSSRARERSDYQRLEFLGDSCLKLCASVQLISKKPMWHEGYLSAGKDKLVANSRLAKAALDLGLDKFILTKPFTGHKWRPLCNHEVLSAGSLKGREMSTKVLADVVEALLGAAMVEEGISKVLSCLQRFLPEIEWDSLETGRDILYGLAPPDIALLPTLQPLETLIGYKFTKKSLLIQAMTHASSNNGFATYERLEFLGDAILEKVVTDKIFEHASGIPPAKMHLIRTAVVNADFLAFLCMEWSIDEKTFDVTEDHATSKFHPNTSTVKKSLWTFMRYTSSDDMARLQAEITTHHTKLREPIISAIISGIRVPWTLLAGLGAQKWYSDLIESLLGALYIDSGSFSACEEVLERIGLLAYLRRLLDEDVHLLHPKEELGRLADTEKVTYLFDMDKEMKDEKGGKLCTCEILVGERSVAKASGGLNKMEVMTRAADEAVRTFDFWKTSRTENKPVRVVDEMDEDMAAENAEERAEDMVEEMDLS